MRYDTSSASCSAGSSGAALSAGGDSCGNDNGSGSVGCGSNSGDVGGAQQQQQRRQQQQQGGPRATLCVSSQVRQGAAGLPGVLSRAGREAQRAATLRAGLARCPHLCLLSTAPDSPP